MKKSIFTPVLLVVILFATSVKAQMGIGTATPNAAAQLDVASTTKGFLAPRMTLVQRNAIATSSTTKGLLIYQIDGTAGFYYHDGAAWVSLSAINAIPYTGATGAVNLGAYDLTVNGITLGKGAGNISTNTASGLNALQSNTTGSENTASGQNALASNTTGFGNTASGMGTLASNTTGIYNTAIGLASLQNNTFGERNTALGFWALLVNTTGEQNTAIGSNTLQSNTTGFENTAVGMATLASNTTGYDNTASGRSALSGNTTGFENIASGAYSLTVNTTGNNNIGIGTGANVASGNLNNAIAIGSGAIVTGSNHIQIGNGSIDTVFTSGKLKLGTITYPNTDGTANQVLSTNGSGIISWATAAGGGSYVDLTTAQSVGGLKTFTSIEGLQATGTYGSGTASALGASTRMMWYPKKSAFRAGSVNGTQWDDASIGNYSVAMGSNTTASGQYSTAMGLSTAARGLYSTAMGNGTSANDSYSTAFGRLTVAGAGGSTAMGDQSQASGSYSTAMGYATKASGLTSTTMGDFSSAKSYAETAIGVCNTDYTPISATVFNAADRLFVIGNGYKTTDANNVVTVTRSDALIMLKNGNTAFSGTVTGVSFTSTSDKRLKKNITPLKNSIDAIMQLNPVSYEKKNSLASTEYNITENGFIAQELQKVMPSLVVMGTDKDKLLSVNYIAIIPVLTKAIQEQQSAIQEHKKENLMQQKAMLEQKNAIQDQQNQISELKKMVEQLMKK